jgi:hypothetical protein
VSEQSDANKALVLEYMEAFRTFDTDRSVLDPDR